RACRARSSWCSGNGASRAFAISPASKVTSAGSPRKATATTRRWSRSTDPIPSPIRGSTMKTASLPLLALALGALLAGHASASDPARDEAAANAKELALAREELRRAASRVAELAREQGDVASEVRNRIEQARTRPMIGVLLSPDDQPGVRITGVTPDGAAATAGLRSGDRLLSVDGVQILGSNAELRLANARKLLGALPADRPATLGYQRGGRKAGATVTPKPSARAFAFSTGDGGRFEWIDEAQFERTISSAMEGLDAGLL